MRIFLIKKTPIINNILKKKYFAFNSISLEKKDNIMAFLLFELMYSFSDFKKIDNENVLEELHYYLSTKKLPEIINTINFVFTHHQLSIYSSNREKGLIHLFKLLIQSYNLLSNEKLKDRKYLIQEVKQIFCLHDGFNQFDTFRTKNFTFQKINECLCFLIAGKHINSVLFDIREHSETLSYLNFIITNELGKYNEKDIYLSKCCSIIINKFIEENKDLLN